MNALVDPTAPAAPAAGIVSAVAGVSATVGLAGDVDALPQPGDSNAPPTLNGIGLGAPPAEGEDKNATDPGDDEIQTLALEMQGDAMDAGAVVMGHTSPTEATHCDAAAPPTPDPAPTEETEPASNPLAILNKYCVIDPSILNHAELKLLTGAFAKATEQRRQDELKTLLEGCIEKADLLGVSEANLTSRLKTLYSHRGLRQGQGSAAGYSGGSTDSNGQRPVKDKTYRHPATGKQWTKTHAQGSAKKEFVDLIRAGHTWAELEVENQAT